MTLAKYKNKRDFKSTSEPQGGATGNQSLAFVIQKHHASHLHYDFRLEMEGVLKSWAVPKGPSLDPKVNRLAMMVEDHPFDYRNFEGTIPEGNYGAGSVIVWDEGNYAPSEHDFTSKSEADKLLRRGLHQGKIKFVLNGHKLKGEFILLKTSTRGENAWILKKLQDDYASKEDILKNDKSVKTGKSLEQLGGKDIVVKSPVKRRVNRTSKAK